MMKKRLVTAAALAACSLLVAVPLMSAGQVPARAALPDDLTLVLLQSWNRDCMFGPGVVTGSVNQTGTLAWRNPISETGYITIHNTGDCDVTIQKVAGSGSAMTVPPGQTQGTSFGGNWSPATYTFAATGTTCSFVWVIRGTHQ